MTAAETKCEACGHPQRASRREVEWTHSFNLHDEIRALETERDGLRAKLKASRGRCIFHQDDYCEDCEEVRAALDGEGKSDPKAVRRLAEKGEGA